MDGERTGPPAWLPSAVAAASRSGTASDDDLLSGRAWDALLEALRRAGALVRSDRAPAPPAERTAGYRHLLVLLALGIDEALRAGDPAAPHLRPGNVDAVLKWGMDCPDAAYLGAPVRSGATYRLQGRRGTVRYLGFQVMSGIESVANVVADDLEIEPDGGFELVLADTEQPGNWMPLPDGASSLVVRQFFYDWAHEEPARLSIERVGGAPRRGDHTPDGPATLARQLVALGELVESSLDFWLDVDEGTRASGANRFREPAARTDLGGAAENVTVWGSWELDDDQALVVEVRPPEARYWSVALGNCWWESLDYANHQTSLNGHQATLDADGVFRAVAAHRDPGVANWLDTTGFRRGPMIFRYVRAEAAPVPETRVVTFDELDEVLPDGTARVGADERREALARRRAGVRRRFVR